MHYSSILRGPRIWEKDRCYISSSSPSLFVNTQNGRCIATSSRVATNSEVFTCMSYKIFCLQRRKEINPIPNSEELNFLPGKIKSLVIPEHILSVSPLSIQFLKTFRASPLQLRRSHSGVQGPSRGRPLMPRSAFRRNLLKIS